MAEGVRSSTSRRSAFLACLGALLPLVILGLPAWLASSLDGRMQLVGLRIDPERAFFSLDTPVLLYAVLPLALLGIFTLVTAPGLIMARALARGPCDLDRLVVNGMFLGLVATAGYGALGGWMHDDETFRGAGTLVLAVSAALALLVLKTSAGQDPPPGSGGRAFGLAVVFPVLLIATLSAPKIFWEQATGDGAHSFEAARLLLHGRSPFFPRAAGAIANYPGVSSMLSGLQAVPFLSLMGETIAAPRLTMLLNLGFLAAALRLHLAPVLRNRLSINLLMWGALVATYLALGWSASYDAYSADLALPASQDLLLLAGVVATLDAWRRREWMRFCGFCFVTLTVSPGAALLLIFLPLARVLASGPGTGAALVRLVFALGVAFALHAGLAWLATRYWGQEAGAEYQSRAMLSRLRYLDFGDPRRWLWLIPGGLFPLAVYFRLCRIGVEARTIAGLGALSFVFYGLLIRTNLHYFAPAMVLPLTAWLAARKGPLPRRSACWSFALVIVAIGLCVPKEPRIATVSRDLGQTIDLEGVPGYEEASAESFLALDALYAFFPPDHDHDVPDKLVGGSSLAWNYHGRRKVDDPEALLGLARRGQERPGWEVVQVSGDWAAAVEDRAAWMRLRRSTPRSALGPAFLRVPRERLFMGRGLEDGPWVVDLKRLARRMGLADR